ARGDPPDDDVDLVGGEAELLVDLPDLLPLVLGHVLDFPGLAGDLGLEEGALGLGGDEGPDPHGNRPRDRGGDAAEGDGAHVAQGGGHAGQEADGRDHPVVQPEDDLAHEAALGGVPGLVVEALERLGEPGDRRRGGRSLLGLGHHGVRPPGRRPYRLQALAGKGFSTSKPEFHLDIRGLQRYSPADLFERKSGGLGGRGEMAVYTVLDKRELAEVVEDHGLVKLLAAHGVAAGSVNTTYLLETARGKHLLRVDEVKGELEVKRELDLLLFLRKHGFPCPQPIADRKGRHYREAGGKCLSVYRWYDGHVLRPERINAGQLESIGRVLADLHTIGKSYKKGIENRFSFERVAGLYGEGYNLKRFEALIAGYESLRALSLAEWDAFPNELRFSALRFTVTRMRDFFLNPVDDPLRVNKDFREFYERLRILRRERDGGMEGLLMAMATGYDYRKYQKVKALEKKGTK